MPDSDQPPSNTVTAVKMGTPVGEQIRDLRKGRNMTIVELAKKIGRSVGYISQIERNISLVSIDRLTELAEALGVQNNWFFQGGSSGPVHEQDLIVRASDRRHLTFTGADMCEELLSPNLGGDFEMIMTTYGPHASSGDKLYSRPCQEAALVIEGRIIVQIRDRQFVLNVGDTITFDGREPHNSRNPDTAPARVVWTLSPPVY